jgi:hypothetical protein
MYFVNKLKDITEFSDIKNYCDSAYLIARKLFGNVSRNASYYSSKNAFRRVHSDESGSATVEFVLLAIPLFLPILLFLNHFATLSNSELVARTLVRESLRAYITSPNNEVAPDRAWQVMTIGGRAEGLTEDQIKALDIDFECSATPCITPNGRIKATLRMQLPNQGRVVIAQAEEYISPWQFNGEEHGVQPKLTIEPGVIIDMALGSLIDLLPPELNYSAKFLAANL